MYVYEKNRLGDECDLIQFCTTHFIKQQLRLVSLLGPIKRAPDQINF